jgi:hypothetical protein
MFRFFYKLNWIWIIIQDQYERCLATAVGKTFVAPNPEFSQRETEREARRFQNSYENNLFKSKNIIEIVAESKGCHWQQYIMKE